VPLLASESPSPHRLFQAVTSGVWFASRAPQRSMGLEVAIAGRDERHSRHIENAELHAKPSDLTFVAGVSTQPQAAAARICSDVSSKKQILWVRRDDVSRLEAFPKPALLRRRRCLHWIRNQTVGLWKGGLAFGKASHAAAKRAIACACRAPHSLHHGMARADLDVPDDRPRRPG
jgi:hypothetical protein